ncbi:MAG: PhoH family protein [Desulfurococcales archaeon]|nr:PhoH family protein [Desulfurococcales archaeon]
MALEELKGVFEKLEPKTPGQEELKDALASEKDLVGVFGPTGTGKSLFSIIYAISKVAEGDYQRVVLARPVIDVVSGREVTILSDPETYRRLAAEYLMDIIGGFLGVDVVKKLLGDERLILVDPHFLRGRTFDNSVIIIDDAQSIPPEAIVEIITRLGSNSKLIVAGDPVFQRTAEAGRDGASLAREILQNEPTAVVVDMGIKDIVRPGARRGVKLLLELQMRRRELSETERKILETAKLHAPDADIITIIDLQDMKRAWEIASEHVPDALIIVKEGHLGRLIGRGGERIQKIEGDLGLKLRAIEFTLDFKELVRAAHPVSWIHKHVVDFDFAGPQLRMKVYSDYMGPMLGQKGAHIRFFDEMIKKLVGVGVYVEPVEPVGEESRRRRRRR